MSPSPSNQMSARLTGAVAVFLLGALLAATFCQTLLSSRQLASNFISPTTWTSIVMSFHATLPKTTDQGSVELPFSSIFVATIALGIATWLGGAAWLVFKFDRSWADAIVEWGWYGWIWWCLLDLWEWTWIAAGITGFESFAASLSVTPQFWLAFCLAGWATTFLSLQSPAIAISEQNSKTIKTKWLWLICGLYSIVFVSMNWQLYFNLLVPHGDSAMYEEHLWNLLHGKGFRSYLDRGLFLGEHIQFVHLFLLPLYVFWPSHLLLEASSTIALALGAFPVFWMTRRQTGSDQTAFAASIAYLFYFPMQFLDIEIDLKTFRPESFGIPLLLLTLDQLDRKSLVGTLAGIAACLTVKEDYTLIFGPLGIWIAFCPAKQSPNHASGSDASTVVPKSKIRMILGLSLSLLSVAYLWFAMRIIMPWFRSGDEVHYASYFSRFGSSPEEILVTWLTKPWLVFESLFNPDTAIYAIALLAPLAFIPLFAPTRLAVVLPLFAILCLNELEGSRSPQHQFHAPLVAVIFWSLAAAIPRVVIAGTALMKRINVHAKSGPIDVSAIVRRFLWTSSLATGLFFSLGPLGIPFWDAGSSWYWRRLYVVSHRAEMFDRVAAVIPKSARVASTDFVHPRFTHNDRSYDYSEYTRKVNADGKRVPDDTEYIVIDTRHRYSKIKQPSEVPEFRDEPDQWELLPDETDGNFIVLKRK